MSRRLRFLFTLAAVCASCPQLSPAPVVYQEGAGWTMQSEEPIELKNNATEQFELAEKYEKENDLKRALDAYRITVRRYPRATISARAQFKVGELTDRLGNPQRAFTEYQQLISRYPKSSDFEAAIGAQFTIAKQFLDGKRIEVFGVPTIASMTRAEEMFVQIINNAPFIQKYAAAAQFNIGQAREKQGDYTRAIEAYQKIIDDYPYSDMTDDAQYQIGYVYMKASRSGEYDQSTSVKANEAFEDFIYRYPNSEKLAQAKENMKMLNNRQSQGSMSIAKFYDKQKNYKAAAIYYNEIIRTEPDSPDGKAAQARLDQLKKLVGAEKLTFAPPVPPGAKTTAQQRLQSQINATSRPDYVGPPGPGPGQAPRPGPAMRTSPDDVAPLPPVEPDLPTTDQPALPEPTPGAIPVTPESSPAPQASPTTTPQGD